MSIYKLLLIICDSLLVNLSMLIALLLRFDGNIPVTYLSSFSHYSILFTVLLIFTFAVGGLYKSLWTYAGIKEFFQVALCTTVGLSLFYFTAVLSGYALPLSVCMICCVLSLVNICGIRFTYRIIRRLKYFFPLTLSSSSDTCRILLVGAGEAASIIITEIRENMPSSRVLLAVDDSPHKQHAMISHIPVKGKISDIPALAQKYSINKIIIAIPSASHQRISEIITLCNTTNCKLEIFSGIQDALGPTVFNRLRPVNIEDLLGRDEIQLDNSPLFDTLTNKTVLVTGGGGSIGSELCRQVLHYHPRKLIIFDIYENNAYELQNELLSKGILPERLEVIIGSVRDAKKLHQVFQTFMPDVVFHAAAHKHVPLMETNPCEAIKNNVYGTLNTALCARHYKVQKFVLISTDKAVNPTNIMGASKRLCEMIIQGLAQTHSFTSFTAVRFGNVLGSNGSVIPLFKKQLEMGGPLTVTHEEIIRYFMTIPEAVRLILQTSIFAKGGEIFVLDMGNPVKIMDLAKNFIRLSGLTEGKDIDIKITGLRPGEKLYEELLMAEEGLAKTSCDKIFVAHPLSIDFDQLQKELIHLEDFFYQERELKLAIMKIVPTYHPKDFNEDLLEQLPTSAAL